MIHNLRGKGMSHLPREIAGLFKIGDPPELRCPAPNVKHASAMPPHLREASEPRVAGPSVWDLRGHKRTSGRSLNSLKVTARSAIAMPSSWRE